MVVQRWTDEMIDGLASSVTEMREGMSEMRESITEMRESMSEMRESITEMHESMSEMRESINTLHDSVDGLRLTSQALLQVAGQHQQEIALMKEEIQLAKEERELMKQRQAENDQRFNILLEEVRYLIRRNDKDFGDRQN